MPIIAKPSSIILRNEIIHLDGEVDVEVEVVDFDGHQYAVGISIASNGSIKQVDVDADTARAIGQRLLEKADELESYGK